MWWVSVVLLILSNKLCDLLLGMEITSLVLFCLVLDHCCLPEVESLVGSSQPERMYCLAHFSPSAFFLFIQGAWKRSNPYFELTHALFVFWHSNLTRWGEGSNFVFIFLFLNFAHCNWKFRNEKERLVFFCCCWQNFLSLPLFFFQLTARKTVFMATAWPPTPASVNRAGEGRTVLAVSPPAAAVCDRERLSLWDWCSPLCLLARGKSNRGVVLPTTALFLNVTHTKTHHTNKAHCSRPFGKHLIMIVWWTQHLKRCLQEFGFCK